MEEIVSQASVTWLPVHRHERCRTGRRQRDCQCNGYVGSGITLKRAQQRASDRPGDPGRTSLPDRATIANMAAEYGATMGFFPIDAETLRYLRQTGRDAAQIDLVERYAKTQGLWRDVEPAFQTVVTFDIGSVEPSLAGVNAGRRNPQFRRSKIPHFRRSGRRVGVAVFWWPTAPARVRRRCRRGDDCLGADVLGHEFGVLA